IRLELAPTGSISGRILDSDGEPLGRVEVQALQSLYQDGLHLDHQPEDFLEVVIGETTASVEGRVTDGTRPVSNAIVVLVPSSNLRQRSDLYYYAATDGNGHFQIQARIVPGDYKVLVLLLQS